MQSKFINELLGITESYEMPEKLLSILLSENKDKFLDNVAGEYDFGKDDFRDYFQQEHGDRDRLKQDYTPDCICKLISLLSQNTNNLLDVCAGTGALTISQWNKNNNTQFYCEELSARAIPMLICNMALRNVNAVVLQKDVLERKITACYKLTKGNKYSYIQIQKIESIVNINDIKFDLIISNPPYSLNWEPQADERFFGWSVPPKSKADYAFVLDIVSRLSDNGEAYIVLPHGVLFRGANEGKIRRQLIENNLINAVIGLPNKLFMNTDIPVCILNIKKNKQNNDILFIDASKKLFEKKGKINNMTDEDLRKVAAAYNLRSNVEKLASVVDFKTLKENDFNLNIPRYVDTFEKADVPDIMEVASEIMELEEKSKQAEMECGKMLAELVGNDEYNMGIKKFVNWLCSR